MLPIYERLMQRLEENKERHLSREYLTRAGTQLELLGDLTTFQHHLSAAINLAWIKLDQITNVWSTMLSTLPQYFSARCRNGDGLRSTGMTTKIGLSAHATDFNIYGGLTRIDT